MRRAFVLTELLVFALVVTVLSMWLLPKALEARMRENEEHAVRYLRMIAGGQAWWEGDRGAYVSLRQLAEQVPPAPEGVLNLRTPSLALDPPVIFGEDGVAHRSGYRFLGGNGPDGRPVGCWGWPNLRTYSGDETFWVDYADGTVWRTRVAASWTDTPGTLAPTPDLLIEPVLPTGAQD